MNTYATKMAQIIIEPNPIIIGFSFGGMLATELAKQHPDWKIFIISSAKTRAELGYDNNLLKWVSRNEIIPAPLFNIPRMSGRDINNCIGCPRAA